MAGYCYIPWTESVLSIISLEAIKQHLFTIRVDVLFSGPVLYPSTNLQAHLQELCQVCHILMSEMFM